MVDLERRMQLSPLWGLNRLLEVAPNFPEPGSSYRIRVLTDKPFGLSNGTLNPSQSAFAGLIQGLFLMLGHTGYGRTNQAESDISERPATATERESWMTAPVEQEYFVGEYQPPHKFSYYLNMGCKMIVTWRFQNIPFGTRVNYEEVFCDENFGNGDFVSTVQHVIREWLANIKRYSELRDGLGHKMIKWFLDHFYLKLRPDQRHVVLLMLYMQAIGLGTFLVALIGWGIVSLFL